MGHTSCYTVIIQGGFLSPPAVGVGAAKGGAAALRRVCRTSASAEFLLLASFLSVRCLCGAPRQTFYASLFWRTLCCCLRFASFCFCPLPRCWSLRGTICNVRFFSARGLSIPRAVYLFCVVCGTRGASFGAALLPAKPAAGCCLWHIFVILENTDL